MSRRTTTFRSDRRDGTSQRDRDLPALRPGSVAIDERTHADLLAFVRTLAAQLPFYTADPGDPAPRKSGTWAPFVGRDDDLPIADILAHIADPDRATGERARWLARPHFALLLAFLELLGRARDMLADLPRRHLEHHYRDVLRLHAAPAVPDRVVALLRLAPRAARLRLPVGTEFQAGRDPGGIPRVYRSERDLSLGRARVAELRVLHVERPITRLPDVRRRLTDREAVLERMLTIALGHPAPGDPIPAVDGFPDALAALQALRPRLAFVQDFLHLPFHELRTLALRLMRRAGDFREWQAINTLLGRPNPPVSPGPRAFLANLEFVIGHKLDLQSATLPDIHTLEDLFHRRKEEAVAAFIRTHLAPISPESFAALMPIKIRIDAEWAAIVATLERIGRGRSKQLSFTLAPADPTDFDTNLATALGQPWPNDNPFAATDLRTYAAQLAGLEELWSMPAERLLRLADLARDPPPLTDPAWQEIDQILLDAHREKFHAARRAEQSAVRGEENDLVGLDIVASFALGELKPSPDPAVDPDPVPLAWSELEPRLDRHLEPAQMTVLKNFRAHLLDAAAPRTAEFADVNRVLELVRSRVKGLREPTPELAEWRTFHAHADATALTVDPGSPRWRTFGRPHVPSAKVTPSAAIGMAVRSPLLALSQGVRRITLTLALRDLDPARFSRELGEPVPLALQRNLDFTVSTAKGWHTLHLAGDDLLPEPTLLPDPVDPAVHHLRCVLTADLAAPPFVALAGDPWPTLRMTLRHRWDEEARVWFTTYPPFERLTLAGVHVAVAVDGLTDLRLQHEDRELDPRRPFEPFGPRPAVGARLYLAHPELVRNRLASLRLDIAWMSLPTSLQAHYRGYDHIHGADDLRATLALVDDDRPRLLLEVPLFVDADADAPDPEAPKLPSPTRPDRTLLVPDVPAIDFHRARPAATIPRDVRTAERHFFLELTPNDFGHAVYPSLATAKARALTVALAQSSDATIDPDTFAVEPPYTPTIKRLTAAYTAEVTLTPGAPGPDRLLHVHPFGVAAIDPANPSLLPRMDHAGELYVGLVDADLPERLSLLVQLAEGTSDPDLEPSPVEWSILDGDRWRGLGGAVRHDATRGLVNAGIVELDLPAVAPGDRLPAGRTWLRLAIPRNPASVCDTVAIHTQAVALALVDHGNAPEHYDQPLPAGSVTRLATPVPGVAAVHQPYTSTGGRPPERPAAFDLRVSERLRHRARALAPWDYERLVLEQFPRLHKAKCLTSDEVRLLTLDPAPGQVDVVVIPDIRDLLPSDAFAPRAPANLLADIQAYLAARAPASARVRVRNARYVAVAVFLTVRFAPGQDEQLAARRLDEDLARYLSPWAYDDGAELTIGGRIYANSLLDFIDRRDYVDFVADIKLAHSDDGGAHFTIVDPTPHDYHVAATRPDQVLVSARKHNISVIRELGLQQQSLTTGINFTQIELDFIVG